MKYNLNPNRIDSLLSKTYNVVLELEALILELNQHNNPQLKEQLQQALDNVIELENAAGESLEKQEERAAEDGN